ncbi:hypothetical protein DPMN_095734 [Dreissena polymorpha]|uniref:Uncharacterized protein n=1 Tax=Dreissena polymorpha TaxID=45954 RepID=A0A9D4L9Y5_DREPO|nr:hypothetical protein DPMN_095734 [Dreissena polymorpha]
MKLHRFIDHDWQMTPIDFQVISCLYHYSQKNLRDKFKNSQKTGGGLAKPFKPSEELILQFLIDRPQLDGIIGGIETSVGEYEVEMKTSKQLQSVSDPQTVVHSKAPLSTDLCSAKIKEKNKNSKRARESIEEDF